MVVQITGNASGGGEYNGRILTGSSNASASSGLAMPAYMLDIPGGFGKVPLESANVEKTASGHRIRDSHGQWHEYGDSPSP